MCSLLKQNACFVIAGIFWWLSITCSKLIIFTKTPQEYKCAQVTNADTSLFKMFWPTVLICLTGSVSKFTIWFTRHCSLIFHNFTSAWMQNLKKPPKFWRTTGKGQSSKSRWKCRHCSYFTETFCSIINLNEFRIDKVEACFRDVSFQQVQNICWKSQTLKSQALP